MAEQVLKVISGCYSAHFMVLRYIVNFSGRSLILWVLEKILLSISYFFIKKRCHYEMFAKKSCIFNSPILPFTKNVGA